MCVCLCESMCMTCVWELLQARTVCWIPWNWSHRQLWAMEWILPTESSTRALLTTKSSLQLLCLQFYVILQNTIFKGNLGQSLFPGLYEINLLYSWVCHRWCTFLFFHIPTYTRVFTYNNIHFQQSIYVFWQMHRVMYPCSKSLPNNTITSKFSSACPFTVTCPIPLNVLNSYSFPKYFLE